MRRDVAQGFFRDPPSGDAPGESESVGTKRAQYTCSARLRCRLLSSAAERRKESRGRQARDAGFEQTKQPSVDVGTLKETEGELPRRTPDSPQAGETRPAVFSSGVCVRDCFGYSFCMSKFFARNIDRSGRIARVIFGGLLVLGGIAALFWSIWAGIGLIAGGAFSLFEAFRGWCVVRACGIKTRM
jgi:hypothetical protein